MKNLDLIYLKRKVQAADTLGRRKVKTDGVEIKYSIFGLGITEIENDIISVSFRTRVDYFSNKTRHTYLAWCDNTLGISYKNLQNIDLLLDGEFIPILAQSIADSLQDGIKSIQHYFLKTYGIVPSLYLDSDVSMYLVEAQNIVKNR